MLGEPNKLVWTPTEVGQRLMNWPGIVGTMFASNDGLVVSSHLPPNLKGDTVAAFLPQIFVKLETYLREMKVEDLGYLAFQSGSVPWAVFKAGKNYLIVIGKGGPNALPAEQLALLAEELNVEQK
jgi:predicted regulator of Ras-like GTPase activity (Roadblock/LC7/MglB family)